MKVDKKMLNKMRKRAMQNNENIEKKNFNLYACEIVVEEFISYLEKKQCTVCDLDLIYDIFYNKILHCSIKKEEESLPSF